MIQAPRVLASRTLFGSAVFNRGREKLGKVEGFGIDPEQGRIAYVVLSVGGFLGFRDKWLQCLGRRWSFLIMTKGSSSM
jgi:hypothetical protein